MVIIGPTWHDPFPKPCYLFALVAPGIYCGLKISMITGFWRAVTLWIYVEPGNISLVRSRHVLAKTGNGLGRATLRPGIRSRSVSDCDGGRSTWARWETKGLSVFNTKYVLAKPETAIDADYQGILSVIGHEYCHNWTGKPGHLPRLVPAQP